MVEPLHDKHKISYCEYDKLKINSVIRKENIIGFQFHPEKSGESV